MNAPLNILAALASYGVKAVIENGRVRLVFPKDNPPSAELIEAARARIKVSCTSFWQPKKLGATASRSAPQSWSSTRAYHVPKLKQSRVER
jgi:hypothetical protein